MKFLLLIGMLFVFVACDDSTSESIKKVVDDGDVNTPSSKTMYLLYLKGLSYERSNGTVGKTGFDGKMTCLEGETVTIKMGNVKFPSIDCENREVNLNDFVNHDFTLLEHRALTATWAGHDPGYYGYFTWNTDSYSYDVVFNAYERLYMKIVPLYADQSNIDDEVLFESVPLERLLIVDDARETELKAVGVSGTLGQDLSYQDIVDQIPLSAAELSFNTNRSSYYQFLYQFAVNGLLNLNGSANIDLIGNNASCGIGADFSVTDGIYDHLNVWVTEGGVDYNYEDVTEDMVNIGIVGSRMVLNNGAAGTRYFSLNDEDIDPACTAVGMDTLFIGVIAYTYALNYNGVGFYDATICYNPSTKETKYISYCRTGLNF